MDPHSRRKLRLRKAVRLTLEDVFSSVGELSYDEAARGTVYMPDYRFIRLVERSLHAPEPLMEY